MSKGSKAKSRKNHELAVITYLFIGLFALMARANRHIGNLNTNVCMIQSDGDEIVSMRSVRIAAANRNIKTIIVPDSGHFYYSPEAKAIIRTEFRALIAEI